MLLWCTWCTVASLYLPKGVLKEGRKKKSLCNADINEQSRDTLLLGHGTFSTSKVGGWQLAVGDDWWLEVGSWWWLAAVGSGWWLAVGAWWGLAVGSWWRLAGGWRLVVAGSWRWLAVGGPWWWSLMAALKGFSRILCTSRLATGPSAPPALLIFSSRRSPATPVCCWLAHGSAGACPSWPRHKTRAWRLTLTFATKAVYQPGANHLTVSL